MVPRGAAHHGRCSTLGAVEPYGSVRRANARGQREKRRWFFFFSSFLPKVAHLEICPSYSVPSPRMFFPRACPRVRLYILTSLCGRVILRFMSPYEPPLVIPSGMRFYTALPQVLVQKNPGLARDVIHMLNRIDRGRSYLFQQVMGDLKVNHG